MKRKFLYCFCITMIFGFTSISIAEEIDDISGTVYEEAVIKLEELDIIRGYPDGSFRPNNTITRAEVASLIIRAKGFDGSEMEENSGSKFSDVDDVHWACRAINLAFDNNLINGYGNGEFGPDDRITYAQAVTMVVRLLDVGNQVGLTGEWPQNYINYAEIIGITNGGNINNWNDYANRGTVALMLNNKILIGQTYSNIKINGNNIYLFEASKNERYSIDSDEDESFANNNNEMIGIQLELKYDTLDTQITIPITYSIEDEYGKQLYESSEIMCMPANSTEFELIYKMPSNILENMKPDNYVLVLKSEQNYIGKHEFEVVTDYSYDMDFFKNEVVQNDFKFYFGTLGYVEKADRIYAEVFTPSKDNKCICLEYGLYYSTPARDVVFPISYKIIYNGRTGDEKDLLGKFDCGYNKLSSLKNYEELEFKTYYEDYRKWRSGYYNIKIYLFDEVVAEKGFKIEY